MKHSRTTALSCSSQTCSSRCWHHPGARANSPAVRTCWLVATCRPTWSRNTTSTCRSFLAPTYSSSWGQCHPSTSWTARPRPRRKARRRRTDLERRPRTAATRTDSLRGKPWLLQLSRSRYPTVLYSPHLSRWLPEADELLICSSSYVCADLRDNVYFVKLASHWHQFCSHNASQYVMPSRAILVARSLSRRQDDA